MTLPTFLGIGAPRAGTTWLHQMLSAHPDVYLPTAGKELHFFDREVNRHNLDWYEEQFEDGRLAVTRGEITPEYARLRPEVVQKMSELMPDLQLIFLIRNPVDRTLSQLRNFTAQQHPGASVGFILRHVIERRESRLRNDYHATIQTWTKFFGHDALMVLLYDAMVANPVPCVDGVLRHIGADADWEPPPDTLTTRVSVKPNRPETLPNEKFLRWYLTKMWIGPTRDLNQQLNGRLDHWVADMECDEQAPIQWRMYRQLRRYVLFPPWDLIYRVHDARVARRLRRAASRLQVHPPKTQPTSEG